MSTCNPCTLTDEKIDWLDDLQEAVNLIIEHGIEDDFSTITEAKNYLRQHLRAETKKKFKCENCDLCEEEIQDLFSIQDARKLLIKHRIPSEKVSSLQQASSLLYNHLQMKTILEPYNIEEVSLVVQKLVEEHTQGRLHLLDLYKEVQDFIKKIPEEREEDVRQQLPTLDQDLKNIGEQLENDNCIIMVAGETSAGKSMFLNLLLNELTSKILAVNNLPSTATICEIKYGKHPMLKAHPIDRSKEPITKALSMDTASDTIAQYVERKTDRDDLDYRKVEIFWPCKWIKHGITITDSPGVSEKSIFTNMVKDYIPKASGFIYVLNTENAGGCSPELIEELLLFHKNREGLSDDPDLPLGKARICKFDPRCAIFICNKWDVVPPDEKTEVTEYIKKKLGAVWKGFDFEKQVFFLSTMEIMEEIADGHVPKEYRRLLRGIQDLLPIGFKSKMESQFWNMYHIMDRALWVIKHYVLCGHKEELEKKRIRYQETKQRLEEIQKRPAQAKKEMEDVLFEEVDTAILRIRSYMETKEVQDRLYNWNPVHCPDNDNVNRLKQLQIALAEKRIRTEIYNFEEQQSLFEQIQQKVLDKFKSIFLSVESEFSQIESNMKDEEELSSLLGTLYTGGTEFAFKFTRNHPSFTLEKDSRSYISPMSAVINTFALPVVSIYNQKKKYKEERYLQKYREDKAEAMKNITQSLVEDLVNSKKIRTVVEEKLQLLQEKFKTLLCRIPEMIDADRKLLSKLEKQLDCKRSFSEYEEQYNVGFKLQDKLNFDYMRFVRIYELDDRKIQNLTLIGEGAFGRVYKGTLQLKNGEEVSVAVKRFLQPLSEKNASDFLTEELNVSQIKSAHVVQYLGTFVKRSGSLVYPAMVLEYCSLTFDKYLYDENEYTGPGKVKNPKAVQVAARFSNHICLGLQAMHQLGFLHRDVKPENILIATENNTDALLWTIKLCDLGVSKKEIDLTSTQVGTPLYMAPEVKFGEKYDKSADMFSFGLIAWEIWYGQDVMKKYKISNFEMFVGNAFGVKQPFNYEPPKPWQRIILQCLDRDRSKRPSAKVCADYFGKQC